MEMNQMEMNQMEMELRYNPNANAYNLITQLMRENDRLVCPDLDNIPRHITIYQYEQIANPLNLGLYRQMGFNPRMQARYHYDNLRMFNLENGYFYLNKNLPLPQNVPLGITILEYEPFN